MDAYVDGTFDNTDLVALDVLLDEMQAYGIKAVLTMPNDTLALVPYTAAQNRALWVTLLAYYSAPHSAVIGYETMNEPLAGSAIATQAAWLAHQLDVIGLIRAQDTKTKIVLSAGGTKFDWEGTDPNFVVPPDDLAVLVPMKNVWFGGHDYEPFVYSHNGIAPHTATSRVYPETDGITAMHDNLNNLLRVWYKGIIETYLAPVRAFQLKYNVEMFVGEFSVTTDALHLGLTEGELEFLADKMDLYNEYNWHWCYHSQSATPLFGGDGKAIWNATGDRITTIKSKMARD